MNNLLRPKKNSWPHIIISIAVLEIYWLLSCWFMTHFDPAKSTLVNVVFFVVEMAGVYFCNAFRHVVLQERNTNEGES